MLRKETSSGLSAAHTRKSKSPEGIVSSSPEAKRLRIEEDPNSPVEVTSSALDGAGSNDVVTSSETIDPEFFDFLELDLPYTKEEKEDQEARARKAQYVYDNDHTMKLALELYNRKLCTLVKDTNPNPQLVEILKIPAENFYRWKLDGGEGIYELRTIRGRHKTPCVQCGRSFNEGGQTIYFERHLYGLTRDKVCEGCMGRNLCARFGSSRASILHQLEECRAEQAAKESTNSHYPGNLHVRNYCPPGGV